MRPQRPRIPVPTRRFAWPAPCWQTIKKIRDADPGIRLGMLKALGLGVQPVHDRCAYGFHQKSLQTIRGGPLGLSSLMGRLSAGPLPWQVRPPAVERFQHRRHPGVCHSGQNMVFPVVPSKIRNSGWTGSKNCTSGASGVVKKEASDRVSDSLSDGVSDAWSDTFPAPSDTWSDTFTLPVGRAD